MFGFSNLCQSHFLLSKNDNVYGVKTTDYNQICNVSDIIKYTHIKSLKNIIKIICKDSLSVALDKSGDVWISGEVKFKKSSNDAYNFSIFNKIQCLSNVIDFDLNNPIIYALISTGIVLSLNLWYYIRYHITSIPLNFCKKYRFYTIIEMY